MSARESVRVAIVGTGAIAQVAHLPILSRMRGVNVVALCDPDRAKAGSIAERLGIERVYRTPDEVWRDEEVDAVVICTPSDKHEEQVREALDAEKYVLCEKPLAITADGAQRILRSKGADSRLLVGMNQRFRPDAAALRSFVSTGELGELFYLRTGWLNRRSGRGQRSWRRSKKAAGGGAFMDLGIQMLDLALWMLDYPEPERLVAHVHRPDPDDVEDSAVVLLSLADGRVINLEVTWALPSERERQYLEIVCAAGSGSLAPLRIYKDLDGGLTDVTPIVTPGRENAFTASHRQELAHFVDVVRDRGSFEPPTEHLTLMRIAEAVYRSADKGKEVRL